MPRTEFSDYTSSVVIFTLKNTMKIDGKKQHFFKNHLV